MFIDTHCHLNFKDFKDDADKVIKKTLREGVEMMIVGSQHSTSRRAINYAEKYKKGVWAVVGMHPIHLASQKSKVKSLKSNNDNNLPEKLSIEKFDYDKYLKLAKNDKVVAIGEVGLDYHHFETTNLQINYNQAFAGQESTNDVGGNNKDDVNQQVVSFEGAKKDVAEIIKLQKDVFRQFIELANEVDKPLIIHGWNADKKDKELVDGAIAYEDILESIKNNPVKKKGVVHSFIGNYKMALRFIEEGFMIGLNGIITYSESYDRLIKEIGLENIIIETDAPYLTPNPLERYSRNEPLNVELVAQKIADVLEADIGEVERITTKNAQKLFKI